MLPAACDKFVTKLVVFGGAEDGCGGVWPDSLRLASVGCGIGNSGPVDGAKRSEAEHAKRAERSGVDRTGISDSTPGATTNATSRRQTPPHLSGATTNTTSLMRYVALARLVDMKRDCFVSQTAFLSAKHHIAA